MKFRGQLEIVCQTDVGKIKDHNEDCLSSDTDLGLAVLADGLGGSNAGEIASSVSVGLLMDELQSFQRDSSPSATEWATDESAEPVPVQVVQRAIENANDAVFKMSQKDPLRQGMGTTILVSLFYDNKVAVGHIGDSRLYRFRHGELLQITRDHSFVQVLVDKGLYTREEARSSSKKNVVTRALGVALEVDVEVHEHRVKVGDLYIMCSDGLTDLVDDDDLETIITEPDASLTETAGHMVNLANANGGKDNISVVLVKIHKPFPEDPENSSGG
ncbi:MAG: Stp1/IreP family PP2C-type Ser/Thr phosphatase [bacterium]|nr:Stp1/IreP family PP2C-type Ser/Thr phosphatase [Pseudomonadales bacterium]